MTHITMVYRSKVIVEQYNPSTREWKVPYAEFTSTIVHTNLDDALEEAKQVERDHLEAKTKRAL